MRKLPKLTAKDIKRFEAFVDKRADGHHVWTGYTRSGYGRFTIKGSQYAAHRIAWLIATGNDPGVLLIRHGKGCPRNCVNPDHLQEGTCLDNGRDTVAHGRSGKGEKHWDSNLTDAQAQYVIDSDKPCKELAAELGVSMNVIRDIKTGATYKHLPGVRDKVKKHTGVPGVSYDKRSRKWRAQVNFNKKAYYLGWFATQVEANVVAEAKRSMLGPKVESLADTKVRFEKKFEVKTNGCWEWRKPGQNGYGMFIFEGRDQKAHRVSLKIYKGIDAGPQGVRHGKGCKRSCVNPNHLRPGSHKDNSDDMVRDGTQLRGEAHHASKLTDIERAEIRASKESTKELATHYNVTTVTISKHRPGFDGWQRGEAHWNSKLTDIQVAEIRASNETAKVLAARYNVTTRTIYRARKRVDGQLCAAA